MEIGKTLSGDHLDILFEEKNKEYGAYQLRKTYNSRASTALSLTGLAIVFFLCSFMNTGSNNASLPPVITTVDPTNIALEKKPEQD